MNVVRGRAEARWLPSRHSLALFRLAAFVRLSMARAEPAEVTLFIDPHQSAVESYAVSIWYSLTTLAFVAAVLPWPLPVSIAAAIPLSMIVIQIPLYVVGLAIAPLFVRDENRQRFVSGGMLLVHIAAAAFFATQPSWVRFAGWVVLAPVAANAIAAVLAFFLRGAIAKLEARVTCER